MSKELYKIDILATVSSAFSPVSATIDVDTGILKHVSLFQFTAGVFYPLAGVSLYTTSRNSPSGRVAAYIKTANIGSFDSAYWNGNMQLYPDTQFTFYVYTENLAEYCATLVIEQEMKE